MSCVVCCCSPCLANSIPRNAMLHSTPCCDSPRRFNFQTLSNAARITPSTTVAPTSKKSST
eukprot:9207831-Prorocentrum_lima.AAC.1